MIEAVDNIKHRCILKLKYGAGLRVSEVLALTLANIDFAKMLIHIRDANSRKDRTVMLSRSLLADLRDYYLQYRPHRFLFEGRSGEAYSARSAQFVVRQIAQKAKITKRVTPHILCRSFAAHLFENGTDIRCV
jgi:integrase/recombinase XerD